MGSIKNMTDETGTSDSVASESLQNFQRKPIYDGRRRIPRRYTIAISLSPLFVIQMWNFYNIARVLDPSTANSTDMSCTNVNSTDMNCTDMISMDFNVTAINITSFNQIMINWTDAEIANFRYVNLAAEMFAQIPGALLIHIFSSHRFLIASVIISSLLHILTPPFMLHPYALLAVLLVQWMIAAPIKTAVLSMWKHWAPPLERTRLLTVSFYGYFLCFTLHPLYSPMWNIKDRAESFLISDILTDKYVLRHLEIFFKNFGIMFVFVSVFARDEIQNMITLKRICGLIWAIAWFIMIPDKPAHDVSIYKDEYVYLQNNIPTMLNETPRLADIPWKNILTSIPVLTLGLVHYKMSYSLNLLYDATSSVFHFTAFPFPEAFLVLYALVILTTAFLADFWIAKFREQILVLRKCFLTGSLSVHALLLLGIFFTSAALKNISIFFSYVIFAFSIPGYITIALDLSPRYVPIVSSIVYTCGTFGATTFWILEKALPDRWLLLFDCVITIFTAGIFYIWGSTEEQFWFMNSYRNSKSNEYQNCPKIEDDTNTIAHYSGTNDTSPHRLEMALIRKEV